MKALVISSYVLGIVLMILGTAAGSVNFIYASLISFILGFFCERYYFTEPEEHPEMGRIRSSPTRDHSIIWRKTKLRKDLKIYVRPLIRKNWSTQRIVAHVLNKTQEDMQGKYLLGSMISRISATVRVERSRMVK